MKVVLQKKGWIMFYLGIIEIGQCFFFISKLARFNKSFRTNKLNRQNENFSKLQLNKCFKYVLSFSNCKFELKN